MMLMIMWVGLQWVYLDGLEFICNKILDIEIEVIKMRLLFYSCNEMDEDSFLQYLKECNDYFLMVNNGFWRKNIKLEVIDSEMRIVILLNYLCEVVEFDKGEIVFIIGFWENIKYMVELFYLLVDKFQINVFNCFN